jgi:hypothetical protein
VEIDPSEMAMSYVSNSDAHNFLHAISADLDLLFQASWKHVLCIEFNRPSIMRALNRHVGRVFDPSRKDKHWRRRKLARDQ